MLCVRVHACLCMFSHPVTPGNPVQRAVVSPNLYTNKFVFFVCFVVLSARYPVCTRAKYTRSLFSALRSPSLRVDARAQVAICTLEEALYNSFQAYTSTHKPYTVPVINIQSIHDIWTTLCLLRAAQTHTHIRAPACVCICVP